MTSASPTLALARRLGTILGLSGGLDGPATLRMTAGDHAAFLDVVSAPLTMGSCLGSPPAARADHASSSLGLTVSRCKRVRTRAVRSLSGEKRQTLSFYLLDRSLWDLIRGDSCPHARPSQAEFSALHLPSLLRTFLNNPITAFDAINPSFFDSYASLVGVHVPSLGSDRFIREHPAEAIQLRAKALSFILDWSDKVKIVSFLSKRFQSTSHADDWLCVAFSCPTVSGLT